MPDDQDPGFTTVVVLTVALAVGANTATFGAIDSVLIETLPVREPDQLVFLRAVGAEGERYGGPHYPWFEQIRARSCSFEGMAVVAATICRCRSTDARTGAGSGGIRQLLPATGCASGDRAHAYT